MKIDREPLVHALEQTYPTLVQLTGTLDDAALDFHPAPEAWSIREILAHLVDDEMYVMRTRLERIIKEEHPHLAPHDESNGTPRETPRATRGLSSWRIFN